MEQPMEKETEQGNLGGDLLVGVSQKHAML